MIILILWVATWNGFQTWWGFIFTVVFRFSQCSVELNVVLGRLRYPLTTYVTVPGLALPPLFPLYQLFEQLIQPLHLLTSGVYVNECDSLGLPWAQNWCDRCSNLASKNHFFVFYILCIRLTLWRYFLFRTQHVTTVLLCICYCCGGQELKKNEWIKEWY